MAQRHSDQNLDYSGIRASGVTAGKYGPSADASPEAGGTITVPEITVDKSGAVTGATNRTITLPAGGGGGGGDEAFEKVYEDTLSEASSSVAITSVDMGGSYVDAVVDILLASISGAGTLRVTFQIAEGGSALGSVASVPSGASEVVVGALSSGGLAYLAKTIASPSGQTLESGFFPTPYPTETSPGIMKITPALTIGGQTAAIPSGSKITVYAREAVQ